MRLLITGGRDFNDKEYVWNALDRIHESNPIALVIIDGHTRSGVGSLANTWALKNGVVIENPSQAEIFDAELNGIAAFPGGNVAESWVKLAKKAGIPVWDLTKPLDQFQSPCSVRLLVTGGHDFDDKEYLFAKLDGLHEGDLIGLVIHGAAPGTDSLANAWALKNNILVAPYPANWDEYGKAAESIRNKQMIDLGRPNGLVAFPGGSGTTNVVALAKNADIPVLDLRDDYEWWCP